MGSSRLHRVLVAEGYADIRAVAAAILCHAGCQVAEADTRTEALRLLEQDGVPFCVLLLGMTLPPLRGLGMLRQLGAMRSAPPVVAMTADSRHSCTRARQRRW